MGLATLTHKNITILEPQEKVNSHYGRNNSARRRKRPEHERDHRPSPGAMCKNIYRVIFILDHTPSYHEK